MSVNDRRVVDIWERTTTLKDGHYEMDIPFKHSPPNLPNNYSLATSRLESLGRKLRNDSVLCEKYKAEIQGLLDNGFAKKVPDNTKPTDGGKFWYLPHHGVRNENKPEKLRVVFDCSAKYGGLSLNSEVLQGPDLINNLIGILLRFREREFAIMGDVEAMFHQVKVPPDDRDVLRFLWWKDGDPAQELEEYRMTVHLFGGVWCPSAANFALRQTAKDNKTDFDLEVVETVHDNFYVDDCLKSVASKDQAIKLVDQLCSLLNKGGFNLTKWTSNSRRTKKIFQDETRSKKGWDDPLKPENVEKWNSWVQNCPKLEQIKIQRCILPPRFGLPAVVQLHHFSDASSEGYGAVSYLRIVNSTGDVHCSFLIGKSRLAPIKPITIPRLELSAAVILVKLDRMLRHELRLDIQGSVFWTDSTVVLQYVKNEDKRFHTFVANRIAVIHDGSSPSQWRYVDSANNPADDSSRGLDADKLLSTKRWLNGPGFLWENESTWPVLPGNDFSIPEDDKQVKREVKVYSTSKDESRDVINELLERYSSWYYLKRAVGWILRLRQILYEKAIAKRVTIQTPNVLTVSEIKDAEVAIIKFVQKRHFSEEFRLLYANTDGFVKRSSSIFALEPVLNSDGLICVGGRLNKAPISDEAKHQVILPKNHHTVSLIVRDYHSQCGHSGKEHVLADIRQKFWIINARPTVNKVLKDCVPCKRRQGKLGEQKMSDLPTDRVTPYKPPFSFVGLDCFGSFEVKRGRSKVKRWGCLFTCLSIRAIHIEKLDSMDTNSFINALKRFECRRGRPDRLRSDNGSNFIGGERELREAIQNWNQQKINDHMCQREIVWEFNPPAASHMGGSWERQIRTVRNVLNALLQREQTLEDEDLSTLFCEVEPIVNSRPLTVVSDNPNDLNPLTPNHLLLLRSGPEFPVDHFTRKGTFRKRWRCVQYLADSFWKRWIREYLPTLQLRQKWMTPRRNFRVGDVVLIMDSSTHRLNWPLGRIVKTFLGKDGLVRSVDVKTRWMVLTRPIDKLCLIETVSD